MLSCLWTDGQQQLYVFKGGYFWEVTADGNVSEPRPLQDRWTGLPPNIEAAAVSLEDGDFYFFKGTNPRGWLKQQREKGGVLPEDRRGHRAGRGPW